MPARRGKGLVSAIRDALSHDQATAANPTAALAFVYARNIDQATHTRLALDKALQTIRQACDDYDQGQAPGTPSASDALAKVAASLSAVTVASDLGPKLLAALDALLLTPKATAALAAKLPAQSAPAASPVDEIRIRREARIARRTG